MPKKKKNLLSILFNKYQFKSAYEHIENYISKIANEPKMHFQNWQHIALMLDYWNNFMYLKALSCQQNINFQYLYERLDSNTSLYKFVIFLDKELIPHIKRIQEKLSKKQYSFDFIIDIINNAERQAELGYYDNAVMRLYRGIEMLAQVGLQELNIKDTNVKAEDIPVENREDFIKRYSNENEKDMKLALQAKYELLFLKKHKYGLLFNEIKNDFEKVQLYRNQSVLVHGILELHKDKYEEAFRIVNKIFPDYNQLKLPTIMFEDMIFTIF